MLACLRRWLSDRELVAAVVRLRLDAPPPLRVRWYDGHRKVLDCATGTAFGTTPVSLWYPGAGYCCGTRPGSGCRQPCSTPTRSALGTRSWLGSCAADRWRSPSSLCAPTWAGRPNDRSRSPPSPVLLLPLGWFTVVAHHLLQGRPLTPHRAAWYPKTLPTFADVLTVDHTVGPECTTVQDIESVLTEHQIPRYLSGAQFQPR
jgi:hypothetical protein